jgi:ribulose-5-phosphate 4-epimerase/fuculose-1-phosphate aldolase
MSNVKARLAAEVCAVTRILEEMNILQYSGHVAVRVPGQDALMVQRRTDSRAELAPDRILTVDFDGKVIDGDGKPPSETSIHIEAMRARPDVNASLHSHMDLAIAFTMMSRVPSPSLVSYKKAEGGCYAYASAANHKEQSLTPSRRRR